MGQDQASAPRVSLNSPELADGLIDKLMPAGRQVIKLAQRSVTVLELMILLKHINNDTVQIKRAVYSVFLSASKQITLQ